MRAMKQEGEIGWQNSGISEYKSISMCPGESAREGAIDQPPTQVQLLVGSGSKVGTLQSPKTPGRLLA